MLGDSRQAGAAPARADALENARFHDVENALRELDEAVHGFDQRLVGADAGLAQRYLDGHLYIVLKVRNIGACPVNFTVIIHKFDGLGGVRGDPTLLPSEWDRSRSGASNTKSSIGGKKHAGHPDLHRRLGLPRSDRHKVVVLVHIVEFADHPQSRIPSLVRLQSADEPIRLGGDILELSDTGFLEFFRRAANGKPVPIGHLLSVGSDQSTDRLVKRGSEIVDKFARNNADVVWNRFVDADAQNVLTGIRIRLSDKFVGVGVPEGQKCRLDFLKMAFCPRDL